MNTTTSTMTHSSQSPANRIPEETAVAFPVETDIFIRPDGSVVIADLPQELESLLGLLGGLSPEGESLSRNPQ